VSTCADTYTFVRGSTENEQCNSQRARNVLAMRAFRSKTRFELFGRSYSCIRGSLSMSTSPRSSAPLA
jgi:hypothetical protein